MGERSFLAIHQHGGNDCKLTDLTTNNHCNHAAEISESQRMLEMDEMRIGELQMVGGCLYNIARFLLNKVPGDDWCCELFFKVN